MLKQASKSAIGKPKTMAKLKHGMSQKGNRHPFYGAWQNMKKRCLNLNYTSYADYGGRGIKVCPRWLESFENFRDDMLPTWQKRLQLDRIDNNGNYEPSNCRWATRSQNVKNRRNRTPKQSKYAGVIWHKNKWQASLLFRSHSEEEAFFIYTKLNDYLKSLI